MSVRIGPYAITLGDLQMSYQDTVTGDPTAIVDTLDGWLDSAPFRTTIQDRTATDGGWDSSALRSSRTVTLGGVLIGSSQADVLATADTLNGILSSGQLLRLSVIHEDVGERWAMVRPVSQAKLAPLGVDSLRFEVIVTAPDPEKYGTQAFGSTDLAGQAGTGLAYSASTVVATNLVPNPSAEIGLADIVTYGSGGTPATFSRFTAGNFTPPSNPAITTMFRVSFSTAPAGSSGFTEPVTVTAGKTYTAAGWFRQIGGSTPMALAVQTVIAGSNFTSIGSWSRQTLTFTPSTSGVRNVGARLSGSDVAGTMFDVAGFTVFEGSSDLGYFNPTAPADGSYSYKWLGTPGDSASQKSTNGLGYPLSYGVPAGSSPGAIPVDNSGTATYWPRLRIDGPVSNPVVTCVDTGDWIRYNGDLLAGQWLDIDCGNRQVLLNGQVAVRKFVSASGTWLAIPSGGASLSWAADTADPAARLSVWSYEGVWS